MRWRVAHRTVGDGHLYQGRFKSFPVQSNEHLLTDLRYIERIPVGAGLVAWAEHWRWSGLWARMQGEDAIKAILSPWPVERPVDWTDRVNAPLSAKELGRVRVSIARGRPFGEDEWVQRTASELRLEHTIGSEGRPPKPWLSQPPAGRRSTGLPGKRLEWPGQPLPDCSWPCSHSRGSVGG